MLTASQATKSLTNWTSAALILAPAIWNQIIADPSIHIPDVWQHRVIAIAGILVIVFRTLNFQGSPAKEPSAPES